MYVINEAPGPSIRALRRARNLTQAALGAAIGMDQAQIARIERGNGDMRLSTLVAILRVLDLELIATDRATARIIDRSAPGRATKPRFA